MPSDALAYVNVSLDSGRTAVRQAVDTAERFPDFSLGAVALETRLGTILGGGHAVNFDRQIGPWLGNEAALALLNTATATAGSLIVLDVSDQTRARAFLRGQGASTHGAYRGTTLLTYPTGSELAFVSHFLVLGQDASVRAAIDVNAGAAASLAGSSVYRRAAAGEPPGRVLDAYASLAGVRRVLGARGGVIGAVGSLLYQPALQGVTISLSPAPGGARAVVHSVLDPSLTRISAPAGAAFTPTLQNVMPTGSILMLDVVGLDRLAPSVLNAGAVAGVGAGLGPLLRRLGSALATEGVNVGDLTSIFHPEAAVAIVPHASSPKLVIVARTTHEAQVRVELAQLEIPLAQLFTAPNSPAAKAPVFNDRTVAGVTVHQLALSGGLEFDYAVFRGLVVISTSLDGVAAVVQRSHPLSSDPGFRFALGARRARVTSLLYLDFAALLALGQQTGLISSARLARRCAQTSRRSPRSGSASPAALASPPPGSRSGSPERVRRGRASKPPVGLGIAGAAAQLVQRSVDRAHDAPRVADPPEGEVVVSLAGRVEVDRSDAQDPLPQRLRRVDVLDALEPGLSQTPGQDPGLDRQPLVGDRVGGLDAPDLTGRQGGHKHRQHRDRHPAHLDMPGTERGDHAGQHSGQDRRQQSPAVQAHHGQPRGVAVEEHDLSRLWIQGPERRRCRGRKRHPRRLLDSKPNVPETLY